MVDIETLDVTPTSVILSIGAVKFDPYNTASKPFDKTVWYPSLEEQFELGRTTSDKTLEWWAGQDKAILERALSDDNREPLSDIFAHMNRYMTAMDKIWCHGPQFDMVIIEDLYRQSNHHTNWGYWQIQDCRTLFNIMPKDPKEEIQKDLHDAGEDAYWQAVCVQTAFAYFGAVPR